MLQMALLVVLALFAVGLVVCLARLAVRLVAGGVAVAIALTVGIVTAPLALAWRLVRGLLTWAYDRVEIWEDGMGVAAIAGGLACAVGLALGALGIVGPDVAVPVAAAGFLWPSLRLARLRAERARRAEYFADLRRRAAAGRAEMAARRGDAVR